MHCLLILLFHVYLYLNFSSAKTLPVWHSDLVRIYSCYSSKELVPSRSIRNFSQVRATLSQPSQGWVQFLSPMDPYVQMYGVRRNGEWYFMEMIRGRMRLVKNNLPSGFIPLNDGRYFSYSRNSLLNKYVLRHVASQAVVRLHMTKVIEESETELAGNFCMHILETNYNPMH